VSHLQATTGAARDGIAAAIKSNHGCSLHAAPTDSASSCSVAFYCCCWEAPHSSCCCSIVPQTSMTSNTLQVANKHHPQVTPHTVWWPSWPSRCIIFQQHAAEISRVAAHIASMCSSVAQRLSRTNTVAAAGMQHSHL